MHTCEWLHKVCYFESILREVIGSWESRVERGWVFVWVRWQFALIELFQGDGYSGSGGGNSRGEHSQWTGLLDCIARLYWNGTLN